MKTKKCKHNEANYEVDPETGNVWCFRCDPPCLKNEIRDKLIASETQMFEAINLAIGFLGVCHLANQVGSQIKVDQALAVLKKSIEDESFTFIKAEGK